MSSTPHDPFYSSPFGPFYRRHTPYMVQPEYRIYEMNKRLQSRTEDSDNLWWDAFATEFFEDDATLTLSFCLEDGPKRYRLKRFRATILRSRPPSAPQPRRRAKNPSAMSSVITLITTERLRRDIGDAEARPLSLAQACSTERECGSSPTYNFLLLKYMSP
uniref:LIM domain binding 2 n=1 Tax=Equus caballus TaxID=9796 RepID=A0A9L0R3Y9_HORSE